MICKQQSVSVSEAVVRSELPVFWWFAYLFVGVDLDRVDTQPAYKCRFLWVALFLNVVALSVVKALEGHIRGRQPADDLLFYANFFAPVAYLFIHSGLYSLAELKGVLQAGKAARQRRSSTRACCPSTNRCCTFTTISLCVDGLAAIVILSLGLALVLACDRAVKRNSGQNLDIAPQSLHPLSYLWIYVLQPAFWFPDIIAGSMAGITQLAVTLLHAEQIDLVAQRIGELSSVHDAAQEKEGSSRTQPPVEIESIVPAKFMRDAYIKHGRAEDGSTESAGTMSVPAVVSPFALVGRGGGAGRPKQAPAQAEVITFAVDPHKQGVLDMCCLWIRALNLALQASARRYSIIAATVASACLTLWIISIVAIFTSPDSQPIRFVYWPWAFSMPWPIFAAVGPAVYLNTLCLENLVGKAFLWKGFGVPERMFLLSFITSAHYQPTYPLCGVVIDKTKFMALITSVAVPGVIAVCNAALGPSFFLNIISVDPNSAPCTALRNITGTCIPS